MCKTSASLLHGTHTFQSQYYLKVRSSISKLSKFTLKFEYDMNIKEVKHNIKLRTIK